MAMDAILPQRPPAVLPESAVVLGNDLAAGGTATRQPPRRQLANHEKF
jgi:hypothetical protein